MSTIFNELEYAENLLKNPPGEVKSFDLYILRKYFYYMGYSKKNAIKLKNDYCKKCDQYYSPIVNFEEERKFENKYGKGHLKVSKEIIITEEEMNIIKSQEDINKQKILYYFLVDVKNNNSNYTSTKFTKILSFAKVYVDKQTKIKYQNELQEDGFIRSANAGASFEVLYKKEDSLVEFIIPLIDVAMEYFPYYCSCCGDKMEVKKYRKKSLCNKCYEEKRLNDVKKNMQKMRNK